MIWEAADNSRHIASAYALAQIQPSHNRWYLPLNPFPFMSCFLSILGFREVEGLSTSNLYEFTEQTLS